MKKHDLPLTLTRETLLDIRCLYLCLCLLLSICTSGQDLALQRTWMLERSGWEMNVHKSMAVQQSGDHFAVAYQDLHQSSAGRIGRHLLNYRTLLSEGELE